MILFLDTEFTGLDQAKPDLISIALVDEAGREFYAELPPSHYACWRRPKTDPRSEVDLCRLHLALGLPLKLVRDSVLPDALQVAGGNHFRYCRKCLCRGYHSVVHQIGANKCCPVHGDMLEIACRTCGAKAPYRLNVALLDAPYRCRSCGHLYGASPPASLPHKRSFNKKARIAITRLRFSHYSYF